MTAKQKLILISGGIIIVIMLLMLIFSGGAQDEVQYVQPGQLVPEGETGNVSETYNNVQ